MDRFPSLNTLLDECTKSCPSSRVKFNVRQVAAQEKARRLFSRLYDKDPYTFYHSFRVAELVCALTNELGLDESTQSNSILCALFHDVGKIFMPDTVLKKPGPLTHEEMLLMKIHPIDSQKLVESIPTLEPLGSAIRSHHERWDGEGYPDGISGKEIPLEARLILIADTFDAMTSTRIYRKSRTPEIAYDEITRCTGTQFDPELAPIFLKAHKKLQSSQSLRERKAA